MRTREDLFAQSAPKSESTSIDLAVPAMSTSVSAWVDSLYPRAASLDGFATVELYERLSTRRHTFTEMGVAPAELSKEEFLGNVAARLEAVDAP